MMWEEDLKDGCEAPQIGASSIPVVWLERVSQSVLPSSVDSKPFCCPVCNGQGLVSRPPWVAGDVFTWESSTTGPYPCKACQGTGVLWR